MRNNTPQTREEAKQRAQIGLTIFSLGLLITLISYSHPVGGRFIIASGAIIFGAIWAFNYWAMMKDLPDKAVKEKIKYVNPDVEENEVTCPHCRIKLILDEIEITRGKFICPECRQRTYLSTIDFKKG